MWFAAKLLFKSVHTPVPETDPVWEERIVLIRATTENEAKTKASKLGEQAEHDYKTVAGDITTWKFDSVHIHQIEDTELLDGTEIFSRFLKDAEVRSLKTPFDD
jgi:hypothetical protein